jgi:hypothetical protein
MFAFLQKAISQIDNPFKRLACPSLEQSALVIDGFSLKPVFSCAREKRGKIIKQRKQFDASDGCQFAVVAVAVGPGKDSISLGISFLCFME